MPHGAAIAPLEEEEEEGKAKTGAELAKRERARTVTPAAESDSRSGGKSYDLLLLLFFYVSLFHVKMGVLGETRGFAPDQGC